MNARWINICEREPAQNRELQVIVVQSNGDGAYDLEYESATLTEQGWDFAGTPRFTRVVAWLDSEQRLYKEELSRIPKDSLRF